jgi:hypothetical protein
VGPSSSEHSADYWRYWWGSASLLNIALGFGGMSLPFYQSALKYASYFIIVLVGIAALMRYRRAAWPLVPFFMALLFGFGLPLFGQSIADAPGLIMGMLLLLGYMIAGIDRAEQRGQFIYAFNVGALVCFFELLNADIVAIMISFALIRLVGVRAFGPPKTFWPGRLKAWPTSTAIFSLMIAYSIGAASMILLRIFLRAALLQKNVFNVISDWHNELGKYTVTNLTNGAGGPLKSETIVESLRRCYYEIEVGTYSYIGRHATLLLYAACGLVYLIICGWLVRKARSLKAGQRDAFLAAFLIVLIVPLWYGAFPVHSMQCFFMMGRLLALFFALALSMALMLIYSPSRSK